jgi:GAF domain-containing protein
MRADDRRAVAVAQPSARATRCTARRLAEYAHAVGCAADIRRARQVVVDRAADLLETPWVGLARYDAEVGVRFVAGSDDVVRAVARIATGTREGVCWQIGLDGADVVAAPDLSRDERWPNYRRAVAAGLPVRSVVGVALRFGATSLGSLLLYSSEAGYFENGRIAHATLVADHAAMGLALVAARDKAVNLEVALQTSREIAVAIGIIMERLRCTQEQAFEVLRGASQQRHVKVRDLAARVVETGELPSDAPDGGPPAF